RHPLRLAVSIAGHPDATATRGLAPTSQGAVRAAAVAVRGIDGSHVVDAATGLYQANRVNPTGAGAVPIGIAHRAAVQQSDQATGVAAAIACHRAGGIGPGHCAAEEVPAHQATNVPTAHGAGCVGLADGTRVVTRQAAGAGTA